MRLYIGWNFLGLSVLLFGAAVFMKDRPGNADLPALMLLVMIAIATVGALQELAHVLAARMFHGRPAWIKIAAHGGSGRYLVFGGAAQAFVAAAGPASSFVLAILVSGIVHWQTGISVGQLIDPYNAPELQGEVTRINVARITAWVATMLTLVQLLPVWQCDGRTIVDGCVLASHRHIPSQQRNRRSATIIAWIAMGLFGVALIVAMLEDRTLTPRWPVFAAAGLLCWVSSRRADPRIELLDDRDRPIGWLGSRRIRAARRREQREALDMAQLDEILDVLNQHGIDSLSSKQRAVLKRASELLQQQDSSHHSARDQDPFNDPTDRK